jgi:acyl dehydratase
LTALEEEAGLDCSDLDRYMGVPMMPGELKDPVALNDIRRWVQAMHYPNPLHYDETWAAESRHGRIVAPQSFTVACDTSHGAAPAQVGRIPGSHFLFGGDEWWFFGPVIEPGDHLICHRMPYDYKVTQTKFAGPTCFQRGDTLYINQKGETVAQQRSTSIRYRVTQAKENKSGAAEADMQGDPEWTEEQLRELEATKAGFIDQIQSMRHEKRLFSSVEVGVELPTNVLGPHSLASFATEWRAYPMTVWGATRKGPSTQTAEELGYTKEMSGFEGDRRMERLNPELTDGAYYGPSRGHLQPQWARHIGAARGYGYGASMGAWVLDYVAAWAGEWGFITHANASYRTFAYTGDATYLRGRVTGTAEERRGRRSRYVATIAVEMTNQEGKVLATGTVDVALPTE